jgi:predicted PurR-regulated permease PerM
LSGITLAGIVGGLVAVPVAAALQVILSEVASEIQGRNGTADAQRPRRVSRV